MKKKSIDIVARTFKERNDIITKVICQFTKPGRVFLFCDRNKGLAYYFPTEKGYIYLWTKKDEKDFGWLLSIGLKEDQMSEIMEFLILTNIRFSYSIS